MKYRKFLLLALALLTVIVLTGCGKNEYDESTGILTDGTFNYKVIENIIEISYENEDGDEITEEVQDNYIQIINTVKNDKVVEIPEEIDGLPVRVITEMAFFRYYKVLGLMTFPNSKVKSITLPNTLTEIKKHAFYQAKNLESITIPSSLKIIGDAAFAGASGLKEIVINRDEPDYIWYESDSNHSTPVVINGGRSSYSGDFFQLTASEGVTWSSSNPGVATVDPDTGKVSAIRPGTYTITATTRNTSGVKRSASINMEVFSETKTLKFSDQSFDRCLSLEKVILNVKNPNVFDLNIGELKLNENVKIFVPASSVEFYKFHPTWTMYAAQIFPIAE